MNLYLVDTIEEEIDPEFRQALFVIAETPERAAHLWDKHFEWGNTNAQVALVPHTLFAGLPEGVIDWEHIKQTDVTL